MDDGATPPDPSALAADGTAVEIYRRLPSTSELEYIAAQLGPNSSVLDLGAGTGRIADPLVMLGHRVTAVDSSAAMLVHVQHARKVQASFEDLALAEKFDCVLLIGSIINYPGTQPRRSVLAAVARHLAPNGQAILNWAPPALIASRPAGFIQSLTFGAVTTTLTIHSNTGRITEGEFTLEADGRRWRQSITAEKLSADTVRDELHRAGLVLTTADPETTRWLHAKLA
ncbi:class I SAM-dependent methyltransferase [Mycobacterium angelicum]|uniref:SAM-dependent methyltransferase n=1 Tax=Mycobacterium angelicum TaxID=470074 RepID=A0A1W9ZXZ8_MYCAN|nr:class I SAM-dependent methyltransferase [Mycobacterium angelicum]MCV7198563.1 class I SAM-dependent methyltransferase [Mycobacterium angelicum]ORA22356.1 SAM-dependent methyltransferase [Mycobacterium angelicum]